MYHIYIHIIYRGNVLFRHWIKVRTRTKSVQTSLLVTVKHRKTASRVKPCNSPEEAGGETGRSAERRNNNIFNTQPGGRKVLKPTMSSGCPLNSIETREMTPGVSID